MISLNYSIEKVPTPSDIAYNNFCFNVVYEVYGGNSIQLKLINNHLYYEIEFN